MKDAKNKSPVEHQLPMQKIKIIDGGIIVPKPPTHINPTDICLS